jgi:tetratricopeptide (TPR) repeat protein
MSVTPIRKLALASALPLALAFSAVVSAPAMAADPTADQVYSAARSGHVDDALTQMQQVLKDHPDSAKAHFVEAELLAKAGRFAEARTELAKAEQLKPGLPFVSQHAVTALKQQLATTTSTGTATRPVVVEKQGSGFPWIPVIVIAGLVFLVLAFIRRRSAANTYYEAPLPIPAMAMATMRLRAVHGAQAAIRAARAMAAPVTALRPSRAAAAASWARWRAARRRVRVLPPARL